jgi:hypothetical protein
MLLDYLDDDTLINGIHANPDEIGTIGVRVFLTKNWKRHNTSKHKVRIQDHPPAVINEREKKLAEHCVS